MSENYTYAPVEHVTIKASELAVLRNRAARWEAALLACEAEQATLRAELAACQRERVTETAMNGTVKEYMQKHYLMDAYEETPVKLVTYCEVLIQDLAAANAKLAAVPVGAIMRTLFTGYRSSGQYTADADAINAWAAQQSEVQS